jgi:hypothetical protein
VTALGRVRVVRWGEVPVIGLADDQGGCIALIEAPDVEPARHRLGLGNAAADFLEQRIPLGGRERTGGSEGRVEA